MDWSELPQDPRAALTALAMLAITTFLVPAGRAKLEELRARAKTAAHELALRYAREAVRWAANEGRRLQLEGDDLERLAMQHMRAIVKGVKALGVWTESDLLGVLRDAFEDYRLYERRYAADVTKMAAESKAALARLERAAITAAKQNAERAPKPAADIPGGGGEP